MQHVHDGVMNLTRSQDFGEERVPFWITAPKEGPGVSPPKNILKNVHAICRIILHLLHENHKF